MPWPVCLSEWIGQFLNHLKIYTKITPTEDMKEIIVKILIKLLSTLVSATKEMEQGKLSASVHRPWGNISPDLWMKRKTCWEASWQKEDGSNGLEARQIDTARGLANWSRDSQGCPWFCQEYETGDRWWANRPSLSQAMCWGYFPVDHKASLDDIKETLSIFSRPQSSNHVSDWLSENIHQVMTDLIKEKGESFIDIVVAN